GLHVRPFSRIAARARQGEVFQFRGTIQDNGHDMIGRERRYLRLLGQAAVFTTIAGPASNSLAHVVRNEAHGCAGTSWGQTSARRFKAARAWSFSIVRSSANSTTA